DARFKVRARVINIDTTNGWYYTACSDESWSSAMAGVKAEGMPIIRNTSSVVDLRKKAEDILNMEYSTYS
ncbi:hypothetical protein CCACVL1_29351, partial [Corchorus capsularis]